MKGVVIYAFGLRSNMTAEQPKQIDGTNVEQGDVRLIEQGSKSRKIFQAVYEQLQQPTPTLT